MQTDEHYSMAQAKKNFKSCLIHEEDNIIGVCFYIGCNQSFLCLKCHRNHPPEHDQDIIDLIKIENAESWVEKYEEEREKLISKEEELSVKKDLMLAQHEKFLNSQIDAIIEGLETIKKTLNKSYHQFVNADQERQVFDPLLKKLIHDTEVLGKIQFRDSDVFKKSMTVKNFLEDIQPKSKQLIAQIQAILKRYQLDEEKVKECKKKIVELLEAFDVSNFRTDIPKNLFDTKLFKNEASKDKIEKLEETITQLKEETRSIYEQKMLLEEKLVVLKQFEEEKQAMKQEIIKLTKVSNECNSLREENNQLKGQISHIANQHDAISKENTKLKDNIAEISKLKNFLIERSNHECGQLYSDETDMIFFCKGESNGCQEFDNDNKWGSNPYTSHSNICAVAAHSGVIDGQGGLVYIKKSKNQTNFEGSTQNGVTTYPYLSYHESIYLSALNIDLK